MRKALPRRARPHNAGRLLERTPLWYYILATLGTPTCGSARNTWRSWSVIRLAFMRTIAGVG
jgi:hypothetical protein